jgi:PIN domain nuclease of toxin-antitoxin system
MNFEALYVVDTHALIWYLLGDPKLSITALAIFRAAEQGNARLLLPAIILAELYYANAKFQWFPNYPLVYQMILSKPFFRLLSFEPHQVLDFDRDMAVPEMHDRLIVGVARRLNIPLITADTQIIAANLVQTIW